MGSPLIQSWSEIDWISSTALINTVGFLAYSLDEYNFSNDTRLARNQQEALRYSSLLLAIAGSHYAHPVFGLAVNNPDIVESRHILLWSIGHHHVRVDRV